MESEEVSNFGFIDGHAFFVSILHSLIFKAVSVLEVEIGFFADLSKLLFQNSRNHGIKRFNLMWVCELAVGVPQFMDKGTHFVLVQSSQQGHDLLELFPLLLPLLIICVRLHIQDPDLVLELLAVCVSPIQHLRRNIVFVVELSNLCFFIELFVGVLVPVSAREFLEEIEFGLSPLRFRQLLSLGQVEGERKEFLAVTAMETHVFNQLFVLLKGDLHFLDQVLEGVDGVVVPLKPVHDLLELHWVPIRGMHFLRVSKSNILQPVDLAE